MARDRDDDRFDDEFDDAPDALDALDAGRPLTAARLARAKARVKVPAILLIIHSVLGLLGVVYNVVYLASDPVAQFKKQRAQAESDPAMPAEQKKFLKDYFDWVEPKIGALTRLLPLWIGFGVVGEVLILAGAVSLLKLNNRGMARLGSALACVPCLFGGCCVIGVGGGIWSFSAMGDRDVKAAFAAGGKLAARDADAPGGDE